MMYGLKQISKVMILFIIGGILMIAFPWALYGLTEFLKWAGAIWVSNGLPPIFPPNMM